MKATLLNFAAADSRKVHRKNDRKIKKLFLSRVHQRLQKNDSDNFEFEEEENFTFAWNFWIWYFLLFIYFPLPREYFLFFLSAKSMAKRMQQDSQNERLNKLASSLDSFFRVISLF